MNNIGNLQSMMAVATRCQGYSPTESGLTSCVGSENSKSCQNCNHLKNNKCEENLYDEVMASIF